MYRKAMLRDCDNIYALICDMEHVRLPYEKFLMIFQQQIENINYYCLVLEKERKVIGVLNLRFENQLHHADRIAEIMEFAIDASCRNHGLGSDMLTRACQIARDHGCVQLEVACNRLRTRTHAFYTRAGMSNFHYKFTKSLVTSEPKENRLGI